MISEKDIELIQKYANDTLSKNELKLFGEKIKEPEFAQKARDYTLAQLSLTEAYEFQTEYFASQTNQDSKRRYLRVATGVASLLAASIIIFFIINWFTNDNKSFSKYNYLSEVSEQIPASKGSENDNYSKAINFYYKADNLKLLNKNKEAKILFDSAGFYFGMNYKQSNKLQDKMNLYFAGLSYIYADNINLAQKYFEQSITIFDNNEKYEKSFFFRSHRWLTVIYVEKEDFSNCKTSLVYYKSGITEILNSSAPNNEQAILSFLKHTEDYLKKNEK